MCLNHGPLWAPSPYVRVFCKTRGACFFGGGPYKKDDSVLGSTVGSLYLEEFWCSRINRLSASKLQAMVILPMLNRSCPLATFPRGIFGFVYMEVL